MKNYLKPNKFNNSNIRFFLGDARKTLLHSNNFYDVVFLDAFSPKKDPSLWTIDFLSLIKSKMKSNSILVSYSKSVPFRSALFELGFIIGKTLIDNIDMGTIASFNPSFISLKLSDDDFKLLNTRSGIPYRDINFSLPPSSIIVNRNIEAASSNKISRSQFEKLS